MNPSTYPLLLSAAVNTASACVPISGRVHSPAPPFLLPPATGSHVLSLPGISASRLILTRPRHSGSRLSVTAPSTGGQPHSSSFCACSVRSAAPHRGSASFWSRSFILAFMSIMAFFPVFSASSSFKETTEAPADCTGFYRISIAVCCIKLYFNLYPV